MQRTTCGACGSSNLHQFLDLGESPIADAYTATADEVVKTYPLQLAVCVDCRLVQLLEVVDSTTLFGTGYSFYTSASPPLSEYHRRYAESVLSTYPDEARRLTLEIGCNDGDMLRWFRAEKCLTVGVDPAVGPAKVAKSRGLGVWECEFTVEIARQLQSLYGHAGVVIANHVLAHVANVGDMLKGIATMLAHDGVAFIEVQYLPDLLVNNAFDVVYHEHRNFFTLTSLSAAARECGLRVVDAQLTQRQGGSLRVVLRHDDVPVAARVANMLESEWWLNSGLQAYDGVQGRVERIRTRLWDLLWTEVKRSRWEGVTHTVAGYGAPAKATTLLNFCDINVDAVSYVVDSTVAKQGRFIPGTGIPIVAADDPIVDSADVFLLLAWNYAHEIIRAHPYVKRWIVPIPAPSVL